MSASMTATMPAPMTDTVRPARVSIRHHLQLTAVTAAILIIGIGGWATLTQISGAVLASGQLVVESDVKKVQHPTGGVVGQLLVREGSRVEAGDILIRLDETQTRANLDIIRKALDELAARRARNEAERDGSASVTFSASLLEKSADDSDIAHLLDVEARLFASRLKAREGQKSQLEERTKQLQQEIGGLIGQAAAKEREIALIGQELKGVRELYQKSLVQLPRLTALERDAARLQGERGQLIAAVASARGKVAEIGLQIIQIDSDMRTEVGRELAEIRGKWAELIEKRVAAEDMLKRIDMRAPQSGTVHQLMVHTIGGLVTPNEPAMLIVPHADDLLVEARIAPNDIDNVRLGQRAVLRFPAFNTRTTPEIDGTVARVSADVSQDQKTGLTFYVARIAIQPDQLARLGALKLVPGMPVEAHMQIGDRSVLSYLTKPLTDQIAKAWKER